MLAFRWLFSSISTTIRVLGVVLVGVALAGSGCDIFRPDVVPQAPTGVEATNGDVEVLLQWKPLPDAEAYKVYRSTSSTDGATGDPIEEGLAETSYTDENVQSGTTYYYRVTAVADEEGDPSDEVKITAFADPPNRP